MAGKGKAGIAATVFMELNHYQLFYPFNLKKDTNEFADIIDHAAANKISKDQLITWFDHHKQSHS